MSSFSNDFPRVGFIGAGRTASALAQRCHAAGARVVAVASRQGESARCLAAQIAGCRAVEDAHQVIAVADLIFIGVPDDAIEQVSTTLVPRAGQAFVHLSGACELSVLDGVKQAGAQVGAFHPLHLFAGLPDDAESMCGATITIEADEPLASTLRTLAEAIGCQPLTIASGQRALYHAGANYAASFVLCLLEEAAELWRRAGIDDTQTFDALWPLLAGTVASARKAGLTGALSGPVSRGDAGVVQRHLSAIESLGGDHAELYKTLTRRALRIAERRAQTVARLDEIGKIVKA